MVLQSQVSAYMKGMKWNALSAAQERQWRLEHKWEVARAVVAGSANSWEDMIEAGWRGQGHCIVRHCCRAWGLERYEKWPANCLPGKLAAQGDGRNV